MDGNTVVARGRCDVSVCAGGVVGGEDAVATTTWYAERCDEDVHQHDEVQQVGGHVLPEADLPERQSLLFVLVLFLQCNVWRHKPQNKCKYITDAAVLNKLLLHIRAYLQHAPL